MCLEGGPLAIRGSTVTIVQTIIQLVELLQRDGVEVDERRFSSSKGIDSLLEPFVGVVAAAS